VGVPLEPDSFGRGVADEFEQCLGVSSFEITRSTT
jgi:hypothetical protein